MIIQKGTVVLVASSPRWLIGLWFLSDELREGESFILDQACSVIEMMVPSGRADVFVNYGLVPQGQVVCRLEHGPVILLSPDSLLYKKHAEYRTGLSL